MKYLIISVLIHLVTMGSYAQEKVVDIPGSDQQIALIHVAGGELTVGERPLTIDDFYIGKYEVTHDQFVLFQDRDMDTDAYAIAGYTADAVTRPSPPYEDFSKGLGKEGGYPAVSITQQGALRFCEWLYLKTGLFFRLPTEAEWQYACQAGRSTDAPLEEVSWFFDNSYERFHLVGEKNPNALGIYDMLGNTAEWTSDQYTADYPATVNADTWVIPTRRHSRTVKGGSYVSDAEECSCAYRERSDPRWQMRDPQIPKSVWWNTDAAFIGFRVVMSPTEMSQAEIKEYYKRAIVD